MNEAIKLAIENGEYPSDVTADYYIFTEIGRSERRLVLLDPLFWQALGKALGWKDEEPAFIASGRQKTMGPSYEDPEVWTEFIDYKENNNLEVWLYHWHRFIDYLAEGKDADSFFKELIKPT